MNAHPEEMARVSDFIAGAIGLDYPAPRWGDLQRALADAAPDLGFEGDTPACLRWLAAAPRLQPDQLDILARHLTVGETYFFRDARHFDLLAGHILPRLIEAGHDGGGTTRRLRIWSAACCTGEEAYSIAILLRQTIPAIKDWNITLLATDLSRHALVKAQAGVFGDWSFRDCPPWVKEKYFRREGTNRYVIADDIKRMVQFMPVNLAEEFPAAPATDAFLGAMDVILCRNVLMYFTPAQAKKVVERLCRAQARGGWLLVSAAESLHGMAAGYRCVSIGGTTVYRKDAEAGETHGEPVAAAHALPVLKAPRHTRVSPPAKKTALDSVAQAALLYEQGSRDEAIAQLKACRSGTDARKAGIFQGWARGLANEGKLADAIACCEEWIGADKLDAGAHYFRGLILAEQGREEDALGALRGAVFLEPRFALAHFALGNIRQSRGQTAEAERCFARALQLVKGRPATEVLFGSDDMTAANFAEIMANMMALEAVT